MRLRRDARLFRVFYAEKKFVQRGAKSNVFNSEENTRAGVSYNMYTLRVKEPSYYTYVTTSTEVQEDER